MWLCDLVRRSLVVSLLAFCVATASAAPVIVDNTDPGFSIILGDDVLWQTGSSTSPYGSNYRFAFTTLDSPTGEVVWMANLATDVYQVAVWYGSGSNRTDNATYTIHTADGVVTATVNQQTNGGSWVVLGTYNFTTGTPAKIHLTNQANPSVVIVDAVRFWKASEVPIELTVDVGPPSAGTTSPSGGPTIKSLNQEVAISATAASGYTFDRWAVSDGSLPADPYSANTTVVMDRTKIVTAVFKPTVIKPEMRAFWADAFNAGYKSAAQIDAMVARAVAGNYNAIIPEVMAYQDNVGGGHGAYWNSSILPKATDISPSDFDPLAYLCTVAKANNIEVHAWLVTYRISSSWPPSGNTFLAAHPEYTMVASGSMGGMGTIGGKYVLDPGSPDVQEYLVSIVRELINNYPIDGIAWDYIRYEQTNAGYPSDLDYPRSGLARFRALNNYYYVPPPVGNAAWDNFRRREVTELVRRVRSELAAASTTQRPLRQSAALITWGSAPSNFTSSSAYSSCYQDWKMWMENGFLDTAMPMTYYDHSVNSSMYIGWIDKEIAWRASRQMVPAPGTYMNKFTNSVIQMNYARGKGADGLATYSYQGVGSPPYSGMDWYSYIASHFFTTPSPVPTMPWRDPATATEGAVWGQVTDSFSGVGMDDVVVQVGTSTCRTDGNGYYTVTMLPAVTGGTTYPVVATSAGYVAYSADVTVTPAGMIRSDIALTQETARPPVISPVTILDATHTTVSLAWMTDETATTRIRYGTKTGEYTEEYNDVNLVKSHIVTLTNLAPSTTYYYVVVACDGGGDCATSAEGRFKTVMVDRVPDFIVESVMSGKNFANYAEISGTWSNSSVKSMAAGVTPAIGSRYSTTTGNRATYAFTPTLTGPYRIFATWATSTNGAVIDHIVTHASGSATVTLNQNSSANLQNQWNLLGTYNLNAGTTYTVTQYFRTAQSGKRTLADAVKWVLKDSVPPVTPTNLIASNAGGTVSLVWDENPESDIDFYEIYRSDTAGGPYTLVTTSTTSATQDAAAQQGVMYYYVVKAVDTSGNSSSASNEASLMTAVKVMNVTSSLSNGAYGIGKEIDIQIVFGGNVTVAGIPQLQLETGLVDRQALYTDGSGRSTLTFIYTIQNGDISADLDYVSNVALQLSGGTIQGPGDVDAYIVLPAPGSPGSLGANKNIVIDTVVPAVPANLVASLAYGQVSLDWDNNAEPDLAGYEVYRSTSVSGPFTLLAAVTQSNYTDTAVDPGTAYLYQVKSFDKAGNRSDPISIAVVTLIKVVNVTSNSPDGIYGTGRIIDIQIEFDGPVTVSNGVLQLKLETGESDRLVDYTSGSGTNTLTFLYTVQFGDRTTRLDYVDSNSLLLNGAIAKGPGDHDAICTLPAPHTNGSLSVNKNIEIYGKTAVSPPVIIPEPDATAGTENTIYWKPANGADFYWIECARDDKFTDIVATSIWITEEQYTFVMLSLDTRYYYRVKAKDFTNNDCDYSNVVSSVQREKVAAAVSDVTSDAPNGSYDKGKTIHIQVTFDAPVTVAGTPLLTLETGLTDRTAAFVSGNGTNTLTFAYTVQSGDASMDLEYTGTDALQLDGGQIIGQNGLAANLTLPIPTQSGSLSANKNLVILTTSAISPPVLNAEPLKTPGTSNTIQWGAVTGADMYRVVCAVDSGFLFVVYDSGWQAQTTYTFNGLIAGQTYWYRARAKTASDDFSAWSNVVSSQQVVMSVTVEAGATTIASGQSVDLTTSIVGGVAPFTYAWTPTTGLSAANIANPKATPIATTTYQVKVTDSLNQTAQADVTITVASETGGGGGGEGGGGGSGGGGGTNPPPVTQKYTLTAMVSGGHGNVIPATGTYDDGTVVAMTAIPDEGYRIKAWTGSDDDASTALINNVTMNANKIVTVEFEMNSLTVSASASATSITAGQSVQLFATVSGGLEPYTYSWVPAAGLSNANAATTSATPALTQTYLVTVADSLGHIGSASVTVTVTAQSEQPLPDDGNNENPIPTQLCGLGAVDAAILCALALMAMQGCRRRGL